MDLHLDDLSSIQHDQAVLSMKEYSRLDQRVDTLDAQVQELFDWIRAKSAEPVRSVTDISEVSILQPVIVRNTS